MEKFSKVTSVAALLPLNNIDTDMIIPKQFLKTIHRAGLGKHLFHEMRFDADGGMIPDFVLNRAPFDRSQILIAGDNFGCGSSREHAPWSLLDFGIKVIISSSFADIFYNNCFKNGILPAIVSKADLDNLRQLAESKNNTDDPLELIVDLNDCLISSISGDINIQFDIGDEPRQRLLEGLDDIGITLKNLDKIAQFEKDQKDRLPWMHSCLDVS